MAETTVRWLTSDESRWLEDNLRASPALPVSIREPERAPSEATIAESMHRLLHAAGDLGISVPVQFPGGDVARAISVMQFARDMISLRNAVGVSLAFQSLESPAAFFQHIESGLERSLPGAMAQLDELLGQGTVPGYAFVRLAMVQNMGWLLDGRLLPPSEPGGPMSVAQGEVTPLFQIWLMAAVSVGAIVPPYPIPGLFRCSYHRCGRVFLSRKLGVGGTLRFCSKQHGQRYHAARHMKTKSKKARAEREGKE